MSKPAGQVVALGDGTFRIEHDDGTHAIAYAVSEGGRTWVFVDGRTYVVEPSRHRRAATTHDTAALAAPMPAAVTQIHVTPGQHVESGDLLVTLEAMKMELPIRAPFPGTVQAINCHVGDMVQPGIALVDVRDDEPRTPNLEPRTRNPEPGTLNRTENTNPEPMNPEP